MNRNDQTAFRPNYAIPPGETLLETLEAKGMPQAELAERLGLHKKTINQIIKGKAAITAETALQLEGVLGVPASFWNNLEANYREALARQKEDKALKNQLAWLANFPLKAILKLGWLKALDDEIDQLRALFRFFGVVGESEWKTLWGSPEAKYRKSEAYVSNPFAVAAWLREGEIRAGRVECQPYDVNAFKKALMTIRTMTADPPERFEPAMIQACASAGVALVFVPELPKTHLYGATRWCGGKAVIQLSLRGKTDDHLWFTFFHEAAHIVLHGKKDVFIEAKGEGFDKQDGEQKEQEASDHAQKLLIPPEAYARFVAVDSFSDLAIQSFARQIGIAPGIVVGRLQHDEKIPYTWGNRLKKHFKFADQE